MLTEGSPDLIEMYKRVRRTATKAVAEMKSQVWKEYREPIEKKKSFE